MIRILTCSTGSLSKEMADAYGITVVPYYILYGDKSYKEDWNFDHRKYYKELLHMRESPTTSYPTPQEIEEIYKSFDDKDEILYLTISSKQSKGYEVSKDVAGRLKDRKIKVFDTSYVCGGQCILAIEAARARDEGKKMDEILDYLMYVRDRMDIFMIFNTLKFLARGGRIAKVQSLLGTVLSIKPIVSMSDAECVPSAKVRTHEQGLNWMISKIKEDMERLGSDKIRCIIEDADNPEWSNRAKEALESNFQVEEIWQTPISAVSGTHIGPGCWGITYYCV